MAKKSKYVAVRAGRAGVKTVAKKGKSSYGAAAKRAATKTAKPAAKPAAPKPATPAAAAPAAQKRVDPLMNGQDLTELNDFTTRYATDLANIDFGLGQQQADTDYQKQQTNTQAKEATGGTQDAMAARGLFKSSIKDAALYDIEAQRSLSTKFLDDKMTAATLNAGTQKKILGDSKKRFDEAMTARKGENAVGANDALSAAWADKMATWTQAHPAPAAPKPVAKPAAPKPAAPKPVAPRPGTTVAVKGKSMVGAGARGLANQTYRWPDGKQHSRPYRGN